MDERKKLLAQIADPCGELRLDKHMNVLAAGRKVQLAAVEVGKNGCQSVNDDVYVTARKNALRRQHGCVCHTAGYILTEHLIVKAD